MPASIIVNQTTRPAGVAGIARNDLVIGQVVTCSNATVETSYTWTLTDVPLRSALTRGTIGTGATFSFTPDVKGTYRVTLRVNNSSLVTDNAVTFGAVLSTGSKALGWRYFAAEERREDNIPRAGLGFPGDINNRGWATDSDLQLEQIETSVWETLNAIVASPGLGQDRLVKLDPSTGKLDVTIVPGAPPSGAAGGDLSGNYPNPNVARILGRPVDTTAPVSGDVLKWDGTKWAVVADDQFNDGSAHTPGVGFLAEPNTGIFRSGTGSLSISTNSTERVRFAATQSTLFTHWLPDTDLTRNLGSPGLRWSTLYVDNISATSILFPDGTVTAPSIAFASDIDRNTGFYRPDEDAIGVTTGGVERARFAATNSTLATHWLPDTDATRDLGRADRRWSRLYVDEIVATVTPGITDHGGLAGLGDDDHTQYLLIDGTRAMTGQLLGVPGSQAAPGLSFTGLPSYGVYASGAGTGTVGLVRAGQHLISGHGTSTDIHVGGVSRLNIANTAVTALAMLRIVPGSTASMGLAITGDTDTGIWSAGSGIVAINGDGAEVVRFQAPTGTNPQALFAVGSATAPSLSFSGTTDAGFYLSSGAINWSVAGVARGYLGSSLTWTHNSNFSIGNSVNSRGVTISGRIGTVAGPSVALANISNFVANTAVEQITAQIRQTVAQSGGASYTALDFTITETSTSAQSYLINAKAGASGATQVFAVTNDGLVRASDGTAALPSVSFLSKPDAGLFVPSTDQLGIATAGVERARFGSSNSELATHWIPDADATRDLGSASRRWRTLYVSSLDVATPVDHGALSGLSDDDHTQYLLASGARALSGNLAVGAGITIDGRDISADGAALDAHIGAGGAAHALVTTAVAGFMSSADKTKLDGIATSATNTPLSNAIPVGLGAATAGVSTLASRADHRHPHGDQAGGTQHAVATTSVAGFMSATDKLKLDGIAGGAVADHGALTGLGDDDHTQYLLIDGTRAMSGQLKVVDGLVGTPGVLFASGTGLFAGANALAVSHSGVERWRFTGSEFVGITNGSAIRGGTLNGYISIRGLSTTGTQAGVLLTNTYTFSGSSGTQKIAAVTGNFSSQTLTAGWTALAFDVTDTGTGTGDKRFIDAQLGGVSQFAVTSGGLVLAASGTASAPGYAFLGDADSGVYRIAADTLGFATGGVERWRISATGILYANGAQSSIRQNVANSTLQVGGNVTTANNVPAIDVINSTFAGSSGTQRHLQITSTLNQSGGAGFAALDIAVTGTSGTGAQSLISGTWAGSQIFRVSNVGRTYVGGGTEALPGLAFTPTGGTNGLYLIGTDTVGVAALGTRRLSVSPTAVETTVPVRVSDGSILEPSLSFASDTDTGFYSPGSNQISISLGNLRRWNFTTDNLVATRATPSIYVGTANGYLTLRGNITDSAANPALVLSNVGDFTASAGSQIGVSMPFTLNQSGGAGFTALDISVTNTSIGLGVQRLTSWRVDGLEVAAITNGDASTRGQMLAQRFRAADGTALSPSLGFMLDGNTGLFLSAPDQLGISTGGTQRLSVSNTAVEATVPVLVPDGSAAAPSVSFLVDPNTGLFAPASDQLGISTAGVERVRIDTASILVPSGDITTPGVRFIDDTNTGFYRPAADHIGVVANGTESARFSATGMFLTAGSLAAPGLRWLADGNTGIYWISSDTYALSAGGTEVLRISAPSGANPKAQFAAGTVSNVSVQVGPSPTVGFYSPGAYEMGVTALTISTNTYVVRFADGDASLIVRDTDEPNGMDIAPPGSMALAITQFDTTRNGLWVKESGIGDTGWEQVETRGKYRTEAGSAFSVSSSSHGYVIGCNSPGAGYTVTANQARPGTIVTLLHMKCKAVSAVAGSGVSLLYPPEFAPSVGIDYGVLVLRWLDTSNVLVTGNLDLAK